MKTWIAWLLPRIGQGLIGPFWQETVEKVIELSFDLNLSGSQKRQALKDYLQASGIAAAGYLLNLAIELAVTWCAAQGRLGDRPAP